MLFNTVFQMTKVGNSPYVWRQLIPEFTAIVRKRLQAMGFDLWNRKTTISTEPGVVRVNTVLWHKMFPHVIWGQPIFDFQNMTQCYLVNPPLHVL